MNCDTAGINATIRVYGRAVHTCLGIIQAVEDTVDALSFEQSVLQDLSVIVYDQVERLAECSNHEQIDPNGEVSIVLENTQDALINIHHEYEARLGAAYADRRLTSDHEEAVIDEYKKALTLISQLNDATEQLRWAVMEHDADLSEESGNFDNAGDLIKHLRAS